MTQSSDGRFPSRPDAASLVYDDYLMNVCCEKMKPWRPAVESLPIGLGFEPIIIEECQREEEDCTSEQVEPDHQAGTAQAQSDE
jgi:hypothetical protein